MTGFLQALGWPIPSPTDEQFRQAERERAAELDAAHAAHLARRLDRLRAMDAPRRILDTLGHARTDTAAMRALADADHTSVVVLAGGVGMGKTTAALHWLARSPGRPWFATAPRWAASPPWEHEWRSAQVAVLDDLGTEICDDRFLARFDELVAFFHGQCRGLVITTNMTMRAFKARHQERVISRIREAGGFRPVKGPDLRARRKSRGSVP